MSCPSFYAWGGARTEAPLGGGIIPYNSDITFDVDVLDCNRDKQFDLTAAPEQPHFTTMQPGKCMYLHLEESNQGSGNDLVLSTDASDYADDWAARYLFLEH